MNIGYFTNQYPKVSHSFIRREILALERQGHNIARFAVRRSRDELKDLEDIREYGKTRAILDGGLLHLLLKAALFIVRHPVAATGGLLLALNLSRGAERGALYHVIYFLEACWLVSALKEAKVEHLHVHFGTNPATVAALAREMGGPPFSFTVHGPDEFDRPQALKLREKAQRAAFVVAISSFGRSQLYRWCSYEDWPRIKIVHCGVDPVKVPNSVVLSDPPPHLVYVGRFSAQKGPLLLIEAFARVAQAVPQATLTCVGDGEMRNEVEARIVEYGLGDRVTVTGWADESRVLHELQKARGLVLPSFAEGLPVVIMEAMAAARPVLTTYIAGIPELVSNETGWLFPAGDVDATSAAMLEAVTASDADLNNMGALARTRVLERHDIDREAGRLARLILESPTPGQTL